MLIDSAKCPTHCHLVSFLVLSQMLKMLKIQSVCVMVLAEDNAFLRFSRWEEKAPRRSPRWVQIEVLATGLRVRELHTKSRYMPVVISRWHRCAIDNFNFKESRTRRSALDVFARDEVIVFTITDSPKKARFSYWEDNYWYLVKKIITTVIKRLRDLGKCESPSRRNF